MIPTAGGCSFAMPGSIGGTASVTPTIALRVGEWYLNSQSTHRNQQVIEAYCQLQAETDEIFDTITRHASPNAVQVRFTRCLQPYQSDEELIAAVRAQKILEITSVAASGERRLHPLLDCEFGGAFDRFRATHDVIGHAWCGYGFGLADECAAWACQNQFHGKVARLALATELFAVNAARNLLGSAPELKGLIPGPNLEGEAKRLGPTQTLKSVKVSGVLAEDLATHLWR
jgi:hypothetical protein